jgi:hypothetical protein
MRGNAAARKKVLGGHVEKHRASVKVERDDAQIARLAVRAAAAGNARLYIDCAKALAGNESARRRVLEHVESARMGLAPARKTTKKRKKTKRKGKKRKSGKREKTSRRAKPKTRRAKRKGHKARRSKREKVLLERIEELEARAASLDRRPSRERKVKRVAKKARAKVEREERKARRPKKRKAKKGGRKKMSAAEKKAFAERMAAARKTQGRRNKRKMRRGRKPKARRAGKRAKKSKTLRPVAPAQLGRGKTSTAMVLWDKHRTRAGHKARRAVDAPPSPFKHGSFLAKLEKLVGNDALIRYFTKKSPAPKELPAKARAEAEVSVALPPGIPDLYEIRQAAVRLLLSCKTPLERAAALHSIREVSKKHKALTSRPLRVTEDDVEEWARGARREVRDANEGTAREIAEGKEFLDAWDKQARNELAAEAAAEALATKHAAEAAYVEEHPRASAAQVTQWYTHQPVDVLDAWARKATAPAAEKAAEQAVKEVVKAAPVAPRAAEVLKAVASPKGKRPSGAQRRKLAKLKAAGTMYTNKPRVRAPGAITGEEPF